MSNVASEFEFVTMGEIIAYTLYVTWSFNILIILVVFFRSIYKSVKNCHIKIRRKKAMN